MIGPGLLEVDKAKAPSCGSDDRKVASHALAVQVFVVQKNPLAASVRTRAAFRQDSKQFKMCSSEAHITNGFKP